MDILYIQNNKNINNVDEIRLVIINNISLT